MEPQVTAALITGGIALALGAYNTVAMSRGDRRRSRLAREETAEKARTEYEYRARLNLYEQFEPLLFQLMNSAEIAVERIENLMEPEIWRELAPAEDNDSLIGRPSLAEANYELISTMYGLFAPLVVVRLMGRKLTFVDLSLEERIEVPYYVATRIYGSVKDDFKLALADPQLRYDPFDSNWRALRKEHPDVYWWQGLTSGRLETVLDVMTVDATDSAHERPVSFGEFERIYLDALAGGDEARRKSLAAAANPLVQFRPETRPVYMRYLIVQARLYAALLRTREPGVGKTFTPPSTEQDWLDLLTLEDTNGVWSRAAKNISSLAGTLRASDGYLHRYVIAPRLASTR